jgi:hypothetical protein
MWLGGIRRVPLVEQHVSHQQARHRIEPEPRVLSQPLGIGELINVVYGIRLTTQEQVHSSFGIAGDEKYYAAEAWFAEEEIVVRRELDQLAGHPSLPAVGAVTDGIRRKGRSSYRVRRRLWPAGEPAAAARDTPRRRTARRRVR